MIEAATAIACSVSRFMGVWFRSRMVYPLVVVMLGFDLEILVIVIVLAAEFLRESLTIMCEGELLALSSKLDTLFF